MNELKPVVWIVTTSGEYRFHRTYGEALRDRLEYESVVNDGDFEHQLPEPAFIIPDTHRVVPVELLENIAQTLGKCGYFHGDIRAIIDNKEQKE